MITPPTNEARRNYAWALGPLLLLLAGTSLWAQSPAIPGYLIRAGDTLNIQVTNHAEWSLQTITVRPDGMMTYPGLGELKAAELTVADLTAQIVDALGPKGHHLTNPQVFVNVVTMRPAMVYVTGEVNKPGAIELFRAREALRKVLMMAGGTQTDANLHQIALYHAGGDKEIIDLSGDLAPGATDVVVSTGDIVFVPQREVPWVGVMGAVTKVGLLPVPPGKSNVDLQEALLLAGGLLPNADPLRALVTRSSGIVESVDLDAVLKRTAPGVQLAAGDTLWILAKPDTQYYYTISPTVTSPGRFEYKAGTTLVQAMALAGQPTGQAQNLRIALIHADASKEIFPLRSLLEGKDTKLAQILIKPDDLILVPLQQDSYMVLGAVGKPGPLPWDDSVQVTDALARAGGPLEKQADMTHMILVRRTEGTTKPVIMEVNGKDLLLGKNEAANYLLQPGDMVYVPSVQETNWQKKWQIPLLLLSAASVFHQLF